jgi:magnesium chelatase family protein
LEVLRQPLEGGEVVLSRAAASLAYPADFMLVAAMNPCPCGYSGSQQKPCTCSPHQIRQYLSRVSGPLLDRIDLQVQVPAVPFSHLSGGPDPINSQMIRRQVVAARLRQQERLRPFHLQRNAQMGTALLNRFCRLSHDSMLILERAMQRFQLSARAYGRILKLARTIADLDNQDQIQRRHLTEAVAFRIVDRELA